MDPSLDAKTAFFGLLDSLQDNDGDDDFGSEEQMDRLRSRGFFRPTAIAASPTPEHTGGPTTATADALTPIRRVVSDPTVPRQAADRSFKALQVIKGTPLGAVRKKGRLATALGSAEDTSVVGETPTLATSARNVAKATLLRRSDSTPLPRTRRLLSKSYDDSPLLPGAKRRKRNPTQPSLRPEEEQTLKGLAFFYVPDNDIAPARRIRINRAREYGAVWTRDVASATHVVVEKNIAFKDVEGVLARASRDRPPQVVNEDYFIDCIQFRAVLDTAQKKYQLAGQPVVEEQVSSAVPSSSSEESLKSLKLKPAQNNPKKWDYAGPAGTPTRSEESSQRSRVLGTPVSVDSQPMILVTDHEEERPNDTATSQLQALAPEMTGLNMPEHHNDELSEYISVMQEYKDLPLDDEDDAHTLAGTLDALSEDEERPGPDNERTRRAKYARKGSRGKGLAFEERFVCNQASVKDAKSDNPNSRTIEILQSMANYYDRVSDHWRTTAYRKAINTLKRQDVKITTEEEAIRLPSIGQRLAQKIEEIVATDRLQRLEFAQDNPMDDALQLFLGIYGVGTKQAQQWIAQGYRTLDDLREKAKLSTNQLVGIDHYEDLNTRMPRREVTALGAVVKKAAAHIDPAVELIIGGSYRRGAETSGDIDFIITKANTETTAELRPFIDALVQKLQADNFLVARLASSRTAGDGSKWHGCCVLPATAGVTPEPYRAVWRRIDFLVVPAAEMGAALIYFTGNDIFNRSVRLLASKKGMRLNQRGLYRDVMRGPGRFKVTEGELVEGRNERRIFEILGVKWREPHERWC